jgi:hypothetical protein
LVLVANETEPVQSLRRERRHCARRTPACADDTVRSVSASHTRTSKPTSRCRAPARASSCGVVRHVRDRSCSWSSYTRSTAVSHRLSRHECAPVPRLRTLDYRFAASFVPLNLKDGDKGKGRSHAQQCAAQSAVQPRTDCSAWVRMNSCGSSRPAAGRRSSCPHPVRIRFDSAWRQRLQQRLGQQPLLSQTLLCNHRGCQISWRYAYTGSARVSWLYAAFTAPLLYPDLTPF